MHAEGRLRGVAGGRGDKRRGLGRTRPWRLLGLGLPAPELRGNKFLLFAPPHLWSFVTVTRAHSYGYENRGRGHRAPGSGHASPSTIGVPVVAFVDVGGVLVRAQGVQRPTLPAS